MSPSIPPLAEVTTTKTAAKTTTTITVNQAKQTTKQTNIETDKQPLHGILVLSTQNNQEKPTLQIKTREGAIIFFEAGKITHLYLSDFKSVHSVSISLSPFQFYL